MIITTKTIAESLQRIYLEWSNDFLTIEKFAEFRGLSEPDALTLVNTARAAHESIVERSRDERYDVAYVSMGHPDMHNYQTFFNGDLVGYATTSDGGWAVASTHHTAMIAGLLK